MWLTPHFNIPGHTLGKFLFKKQLMGNSSHERLFLHKIVGHFTHKFVQIVSSDAISECAVSIDLNAVCIEDEL